MQVPRPPSLRSGSLGMTMLLDLGGLFGGLVGGDVRLVVDGFSARGLLGMCADHWRRDRADIRFGFGQLHQEILGGKRWSILEDLRSAAVCAVGLLQAGLHCVCEISGKNFFVYARFRHRVAYWKRHFASFEEVAWHP